MNRIELTQYLATQRITVAILATLAIVGIIIGIVTIFKHEAKIERLTRVNTHLMGILDEQEKLIDHYKYSIIRYETSEQDLKERLKKAYRKED